MLSVTNKPIMLSVFMPSVVMLNVVVPVLGGVLQLEVIIETSRFPYRNGATTLSIMTLTTTALETK
jgi:hypothetical protein